MGDNYTEVTSQGYFQRLGGSIVGMLIGLLLVPASIMLLYWNEGRAVEAALALDQGQAQIVELAPAALSQNADGAVVHLSGVVTTSAAPHDPAFGVGGDGLRLKRTVEMFQWKEDKSTESQQSIGGTKTTETTYSYRAQWADHPIDSSAFHHPEGHQNPAMSLHTATFDADGAKLGAYKLSDELLAKLGDFQPMTPPDSATPRDGFRRDGDGFYKGADSATPAVGDTRVSYGSMPSGTISVVAGLAGDTLGTFSGRNGYSILMAKPGTVSAADLFKQQRGAESTMTWILRGVGFGLMLIAFLLIASPLTTVLAFLPFLEGIADVGSFLVALTVAVPVTLLVIALAWTAHRPLMGGALIAAAIGCFVLFRMMHPRRGPAAGR
jgi:hypothetical protein